MRRSCPVRSGAFLHIFVQLLRSFAAPRALLSAARALLFDEFTKMPPSIL